MSPRFLILAGPSCVGKGPLLAALRRCHPDLAFVQPVTYTSRHPRPGEVDGRDFHFRPAAQIEQLDPERCYVFPMRHLTRAIDLAELAELLGNHERVVLELHPPQVARFRAHPAVVDATRDAQTVTALLQPLAIGEALALAAAAGCQPAAAVADVMLAKQLQRAWRMGKALTAAEVADCQIRAAATWDEMQPGDAFDHVLVNHDAEGSDHWLTTPPIGDAGATLAAAVRWLAG